MRKYKLIQGELALCSGDDASKIFNEKNVEIYYAEDVEENKKVSDIKDYWNNEQFIKEGDIVLLHNWGSNNNQIIGVAYLEWNSEYHCWDFDMIAGDYVGDAYDRWRQSPRVIGNMKDGITDEEFKEYHQENKYKWDELILQEQIKANIKYNKKRISRIRLMQNKKIQEKQQEIKKAEEEIKKLKEQEKKFIDKIKNKVEE